MKRAVDAGVHAFAWGHNMERGISQHAGEGSADTYMLDNNLQTRIFGGEWKSKRRACELVRSKVVGSIDR
jgi:hypothetical protein